MPMIYRRNRGLSPTREPTDATRGIKTITLDADASFLGRTRRWWTGRSVVVTCEKVYQTVWLAALVYAFLGLPVLGRVLNFARFGHRFPPAKIMQGLVVGMMQDVAIFLQASTCICLVKVFFDSDNLTPQDLDTARRFPNSGFLRDRLGTTRYLPVYMPVLATEYDLQEENMEALASGVATTHRTLLSLGAANRPALVARTRRVVHSLVIVTLLQLILVVATIASVADFCLQATMHPRLNRAFVEVFFNYMKQFTASLTDEEVLTQTVVVSWAVYSALIAALTFGFYTGQLPLASDFLRFPSAFCFCFIRRYGARKDSMASNVASATTSNLYVPDLFASYWHRARKSSRIRRRSVPSTSHVPGGTPSGCTTGLFSDYGLYTKAGPLNLLGRCIALTVVVTGAALSASVLLNHKGGVDMQLMNNAMFTLEAEPFFYHPPTIHREEMNCTAASRVLLSTLGTSETYEVENLGNEDHCALLWRKTTAFQGDSFFEMTRNASVDAKMNTSAAIETLSAAPNIIVINMESWRHLNVGVLGGAAKKEATGKSATPHFDQLAKTGVLYTKHYTQCVQTTRTLLTTLFGMLPSCTETSALKQYSTNLHVRGLPHFLKQRGYFNLFWSAVDLTWEYWDKFLLKNGFDKLVDDRKVRNMLHETRKYKNSPDDHFSWGMHDHLSFEMLLYAIESAANRSRNATDVAFGNASVDSGNATAFETIQVPKRHDHGAHVWANDTRTSSRDFVGAEENATTIKAPLPGWEGLESPFFIDMYSITSHNPWTLPKSYTPPALSGLYTEYNKKYLDSMYFSDEMLGKFIAALRAKGLMKNTIVIIQGDHGYGRLEHGNNPSIVDSGVWDEASRVPFLLLADDFLRDEDKGTVVDQLTMQSDLMATVADIVGVTPEKPLYQHGYGHSMKRRRVQPATFKAAQRMGIEVSKDDEGEEKELEPEALAGNASSPQERRVVLCNPFSGMTKGVRTEELKYVFHPDGSYNVFELASDSAEKKPVQSGFDVEEMNDVFEYVTKAVDLNQFLFEANRFITPLPTLSELARNDPDAGAIATHARAPNVTRQEEIEPASRNSLN